MTTKPSLEDFAFEAPLRDALSRAGVSQPNDVQQQAWPTLLDGRDVLLTAQTGSGKTLTYLGAVLHNILQRKDVARLSDISALVLAPTRELALQIAATLRPLSRPFGLKSVVVIGGEDKTRQIRKIKAGVQVVVATPGRLYDLILDGSIELSSVTCLVVDEVDRLLDEGFAEIVTQIAATRSPDAQVVLCSATLHPSLKQMTRDLLRKNFARIEVKPHAITPRQMAQFVVFADGLVRHERLVALVMKETKRVIIFVNQIAQTAQLVASLRTHAIIAELLHGDLKQTAREKALLSFRSGRKNVLVTTDVAARGLDIDNIGLVINYDLPKDAETYIHRIGRTARAGVRGRAISFCGLKERPLLREIEKGAQARLKVLE